MKGTEEYRTIPMTGRPPVRIRLDDWPLIAEASHTRHDGKVRNESFREEHAWIRVRQHADGRTLVYGGYHYNTAFQHEHPVRLYDGYLIPSAGPNVVGTVHTLAGRMARRLALEGREAHIVERLADEIIASLPAEALA